MTGGKSGKITVREFKRRLEELGTGIDDWTISFVRINGNQEFQLAELFTVLRAPELIIYIEMKDTSHDAKR